MPASQPRVFPAWIVSWRTSCLLLPGIGTLAVGFRRRFDPPIGLICNYFAGGVNVAEWRSRRRAVPGSVYFRADSGHSRAMTSPQRLPTSLTPLDRALDALLNGVEPVAPVELTLGEALRCIAAGMPPLPAYPPRDIAAADGYAFCARDLVGASSYSPLPLSAPPVWVEAGEAIPAACDCVLDSDSVDLSGPMPQVLAEAIPGQGVRRAGGDIAAGSLVAEAGRRVLPRDLLMARAAGLERLNVRRPRLRIVNVPGGSVTADLIAESAQATAPKPSPSPPRAAMPDRLRRHSMMVRAICSWSSAAPASGAPTRR